MSPLDGLQRALAAEHAALHVIGALGARTSVSETPALHAELTTSHDEHRDRRDELDALVRGLGGTPVAAEAAYDLPDGLGSPASVTGAALEVERRAQATYAWLVGQTSGEERRFAITALTQTAVRALAYRGSPEIFPGMAGARTARR
ncbi:ferritin-like domain-containing protein [Nocardioides coralli]|uniref:ferritin-like domain-containing protein n=1 Tax=Nocardioides coralli TaxID=2872154 RepID=UPI001CA38E81|nr:ferritin-like domain-containing protein [Nocardioides coralli]QZY28089.1 ferritin-like domain-containing protein [Nocardioides coralli]